MSVSVDGTVPDRLYHYRSISGDRTAGNPKITEAVRIIQTPSLYFSDPRTYVDTDDCRIQLDCDLNSSEREEYWSVNLERYVADLEDRRRVRRHLLETDYFRSDDFQADFARRLQQIAHSVGVLSMSTSDVSPVLWEKYGGAAAGVCIELSFASQPNRLRPREVKYVASRVVRINAPHDEIVEAMLLRKGLSFREEEEYRCVLFRFDETPQSGWAETPDYLVTGIILGDRMERDHRERLLAAVRRAPRRISVRELTRLEDGSLRAVPFVSSVNEGERSSLPRGDCGGE